MAKKILNAELRKKADLAKRLAIFGGYVGAYAAQASLGKITAGGNRSDRLDYFTENVSKWCRRALDLLNIEVSVSGLNEEAMRDRNFLLVGNHMSYTDILVTSSVLPVVYVTSVDMGETKFLGPMAEMGGSIFIERRHRGQIERDLSVMANTLRAGHHVMIYPEGTSTNGETVQTFKKSLLMSAVEAEVDLLPVVIKYTEVNGMPFGPENRDRICWYGDMDFLPHFLDVLGNDRVKAELHFLDPIPVTKESTRHELAEKAHEAILNAYHGKPNVNWAMSESTLQA